MVWVDAITFIHPDGDRVDRVGRGRVTYQGGTARVKVDADKAPRWETAGMDVVAAYSNGDVEAAIEVADISTEMPPPAGGRPPDRLRVYR